MSDCYSTSKVFWNSNGWLPDAYRNGHDICYSIASSLEKRHLDVTNIMVYGDESQFLVSTDLMLEYYGCPDFSDFETLSGRTPLDSLHKMLVKIVLHAWMDSGDWNNERSCLVIITNFSSSLEKEMICRVLGSLITRHVPVLLVLPDVVHVDGISEKSGSFPVWVYPYVFKQSPYKDLQGEEESHFIEAPEADVYTRTFAMPEDMDTCVFWDVEDYPLPLGLDLVSFVEKIRSVVTSYSSGGVAIYAYVVKEEDSELFMRYEDAGIKISVVREAPVEKVGRLGKMIMDVLLWSMDNSSKRPNLVVISKLLEDDIFDLDNILDGLNSKCNVILALPAEKFPPPESFYYPTVSWEVLSSSA